METHAAWRNPIFDASIGTSPGASLGVDWLHCLSLGVFLEYCLAVIHALFAHPAYEVPKDEVLDGKTMIFIKK